MSEKMTKAEMLGVLKDCQGVNFGEDFRRPFINGLMQSLEQALAYVPEYQSDDIPTPKDGRRFAVAEDISMGTILYDRSEKPWKVLSWCGLRVEGPWFMVEYIDEKTPGWQHRKIGQADLIFNHYQIEAAK